MKSIASDLEKLKSKDPKVKYKFARQLLKIGNDAPAMLYDYFDLWVEMMNGDNNILKWTAIDLLGYLSVVDKENKVGSRIKSLFDFLHGGHLITANHVIFALGCIAKNKPEYRKKIIKELIAVSQDTFETDECKNIVAGKVVLALGGFLEDIKNNTEAINFIEQAQHSTRNATRKKAGSLLKKLKK